MTQTSASGPSLTAEMPESTPSVFIGNDTNILMPPPKSAVSLDGDAVMVNFEQAPLAEAAFNPGETLGLDYVIEHLIKGEITLRTRSPIPRDQLLPILESLLRNNNVLMIRGPEDRFFVSGAANARTTVPLRSSAAVASATSSSHCNTLARPEMAGDFEASRAVGRVCQGGWPS